MSEPQSHATTRTSRLVKAPPEAVYAAFMDPAALVEWLPPGEMTGRISGFDPREGGGYRMTLAYPEHERVFRGKTNAREDVVDVRFVELKPPHRLVEAVTFVSDDTAFQGEMTIAVGFEPDAGGTLVTFVCTNLPPGLRAQDNEAGTRLSLEQLARRFE
jgi:uncharacterized protein YndB with AHSA1/START domain